MKKLAIGVAVLAVAQMIFLAAFIWIPRDETKSTGASSTTARLDETLSIEMPAVTFQHHDRAETTTESLRGQPVVLHLWGTWCPPCVRELPSLLERAAANKEPLLAVAIDDDWGSLEKFFEGKVPPRVVLPTSAGFVGQLGVSGLPSTLLITPEGVVIKRWSGAREWSESDWQRLVGQDAGPP